MRFILPLILVSCLGLAACEDSQSPEVPSMMTVESGDLQYSKRATALPDPLTIRLRFADGSPAAGYRVRFETGDIGGTLSSASANTNGFGLASTRLTLPDQTGTARVRAYLDENPAVFADFMATSADFFCPEENPTFVKKFFSGNPVFNELLLFTSNSSLFPGAGVIRITPAPAESVFVARTEVAYAQDESEKIVRDAEFSASGDFFLAWSYQRWETIRLEPDFSHDAGGFSALESVFGSELSITPMGVLVGCDEFGPFTIGCRDTLARFDDAMYGGWPGDYANFDAVAVDTDTEDIYYIDVTGHKLMRLPVDMLLATGPPVEVVTLSDDEAKGASGMVVDNGTVYILVDTPGTREIVKVTAAGVKTTEVDFFNERGAGDAAGRQNDLALDRQFHFLYTIDRLNNALVMWEINAQQLNVMKANPADTDPQSLSRLGDADERVGLAVIPKSGL